MKNLKRIVLSAVVIVLLIGVLALDGHRRADSSTRLVGAVRDSSLPIVLSLQEMRASVLRIVASTTEHALIQTLSKRSAHGDKTVASEERERELVDSGRKAYAVGRSELTQLFIAARDKEPPATALRRDAEMVSLATTYSTLLHTASPLVDDSKNSDVELLAYKEIFEQSEEEILVAIQRMLDAETAHAADSLAQSANNTSILRDSVDKAMWLIVLSFALFTWAVLWIHAGEVRARALAQKTAENLAEQIKIRQIAETQLIAAQKLSGMGTMLGGIAHSVNNQLVPILSLAQLMRETLPNDSATRLDLDHIIESAKNARRTLGDVLAFARGANAEGGTTDSCEAIACTRRILDLAKSAMPTTIQLRSHFEIAEAIIRLGATELENLLLNLVGNARDAMEGRIGSIDIHATIIDVDTMPQSLLASIPNNAASRYLRYEVCDSGSGIAQADMEHLFDPFFTTKAVGKGTGLGLAVSYGIVRRAEGAISADSELDKGSCFAIYLPVLEQHL